MSVPGCGDRCLKVLLVNKFNFAKGGADVHHLQLERLLRDRGQQTLVMSMQHPLNVATAEPNVLISTVDFDAAGIVPRLSAALRMLYNREARTRLRILIEEHKPDIVHLHNVYHQISPSILFELRRAGIPVVMTVHDLKLVCPSYRGVARGRPCLRCSDGWSLHAVRTRCHRGSAAGSAWLAFEWWVHRVLRVYRNGVDLFLCPSRFYHDLLVGAGFDACKLVVLPLFIPQQGSCVEPPERGRIISFGRLSAEKGLDTLIRAVEGLPRVTLVVAGDGPERDRLESLARPLGERVRFLGHLDADSLRREVCRAQLSVIASEWYENCPLAVLESFALARPVVAARIGGLPELVRHGHTGWLFEPRDVAGLRSTLQSALASSSVDAMGDAARRAVAERHSPEVFYPRLLQAYAEARRRRGRG